MAKPSHRHTPHVQPEKPDAAEKPAAAAPAEAPPSITNDPAHGRLWFALVIWCFAFGLFFVWLLIDLVFSLFRR
jgi:hypothetical protein